MQNLTRAHLLDRRTTMLAIVPLAMILPTALVGGVARLPAHLTAARPASSPTASRAAAPVMYWHIYPRDQRDSNWEDRNRGPSDGGRLLGNEYNLEPGQSTALGTYDIYDNPQHVSPEQCIIQVADDASALYCYAQGNSPTGWRTRPDEPWNWMQPGESVALMSGWKISLDCEYPESAVYKFEKAGRFLVEEFLAAQQAGVYGNTAPARGGGGYGGQQGGYGQQGGNLPPGWTTGQDNGQTYYYNEQTGQSQWDPPQY